LRRKRLLVLSNCFVEPADVEVQARDRIVPERIGRIALEQLRVRRKILGARLPAEILVEEREVIARTRNHLHPEIAHLVGGVLTPDHARGRPVSGCAGLSAELSYEYRIEIRVPFGSTNGLV